MKFDTIEVGDHILLHDNDDDNWLQLSVVKVTKKAITPTDGRRYSRVTGYELEAEEQGRFRIWPQSVWPCIVASRAEREEKLRIDMCKRLGEWLYELTLEQLCELHSRITGMLKENWQ